MTTIIIWSSKEIDPFTLQGCMIIKESYTIVVPQQLNTLNLQY